MDDANESGTPSKQLKTNEKVQRSFFVVETAIRLPCSPRVVQQKSGFVFYFILFC